MTLFDQIKNTTIEEEIKNQLISSGVNDEAKINDIIERLAPIFKRLCEADKKQDEEREEREQNQLVIEITQYLSEKVGKPYKSNTPGTERLIKARLKEKNTIKQFKAIIDFKHKEWKGNDMEKYLRPSTLFNRTNFYNYLEEARIDWKKNNSKKTKSGHPKLVI